jgi:hypothetical protein
MFRYSHKSLHALIVLTALLISLPAYGQVILFTDRQAFEAATANRTSINFADFLAPGQVIGQVTGPAGLTLSGVNFMGLPANFLYVIAPGYGDPYQGWITNPTVLQSLAPPGTTLVVTLPPGTTAVGTDIYTITGNPNPGLPLYFYGDPVQVSLASGQAFTIQTFNKPNLAFVGFASASPITSLRFSNPPAGAYMNLANFEVSVVTPEPGSLCLLLSFGISGSALVLRRLGRRR